MATSTSIFKEYIADQMKPVARIDWIALSVRRRRAPRPLSYTDFEAGGPGWKTDPAHLLKDLRRLRAQELEQKKVEAERIAATEKRQAQEAAAAVTDVRCEGDTPTVQLARPWSTWLTMPKGQLMDWALLRWLFKRGITIPKELLVYNASPEEWHKDDPPPNSKYMRLLTQREKVRIRKMMEDWIAPRHRRAMQCADCSLTVHRRKKVAWGATGTGGWECNDLVFSVAMGPCSPEEDVDKLMAQAAAMPIPIQESEWRCLQSLLPELSDDQALTECATSKEIIRAHHAFEDWIDRQAQSREHRLLLMARQRLTMARALRVFMEQSTRRSLKRWGYSVFPRSRSAWKSRAKVIIEAFFELYPHIAFAHHAMDPMGLDSHLCKTSYVEADQTALTEAIKTCNAGAVERLLMNPEVRVQGKVPRHNFSYLHLAVLAARHVFDPDCEFWFSRPACLEIIDIVATRGFQNNMDVYDESCIDGVRGVTPLHYAAFLWDREIFQFLIKKGAKREVCSGYGSQSVYHFAVRAGSNCGEAPECVKHWAERVLRLMELREPTDWPLKESQVPDGLSFRRFVACLADSQEPPNKPLINQGTAINRRSPFFVACSEHRLHLVKVLLEHGADPLGYAVASPVEDDGISRAAKAGKKVEPDEPKLESPCAAALKYNWDTDTDGRKVVNYLIDNGLAKAGEGLRWGTASGWPFFLVALAQGMETLGMDDGDMPPGCIMHNEHLLESLLGRGADINEVTYHHPQRSPYTCADGVSAFLLACGQCARLFNPDANFQFDPDISLIEWLLDRNAKMTVTNRYGHTGLWVACRAACFECHCASQRLPDCVCGKGKDGARIVHYLVTHGAAVDQPDVNGTTPLHCACIYGQVAIVRTLLTSGGADPNIPDYFGCFPRDSARMRGYHTIVELIDQVHPPTRVQYMGSMARGDPEVAKVAGPFIDSGMISITHGDYAKASVSFKVALAKIKDKEVLASSAPDLCWMLAYIHFLSENRKRLFESDDEKCENLHEVHRWLHGRMIKQIQRAPIVENFQKALHSQKTHLLTNQSLDLFRCKETCGADDDELLKMILCNAPLHHVKNHLQMKATPASFKALYGRTLPTPLYLSIQYSTPEVFEMLLEMTGDWILGGPRQAGRPAGPGGKFLDPVPECPHYLYPWGASCGDKERSVAMHELHHWLPTRTPKQACELKLTHGWCPVTAGFESVQMRKTCLDTLKTYIRDREIVTPVVGVSSKTGDGNVAKKKRKSGASKKKKKKKVGDAGDAADGAEPNLNAPVDALQQSHQKREERITSLQEPDDDLEEMIPPPSAPNAAAATAAATTATAAAAAVPVDRNEDVARAGNDGCAATVAHDKDAADDGHDGADSTSSRVGDDVDVANDADSDQRDGDNVPAQERNQTVDRQIDSTSDRPPTSEVPDSVRAALVRAGVSGLIPSIEEADYESDIAARMSAALQVASDKSLAVGLDASHRNSLSLALSSNPDRERATHDALQSRINKCEEELEARNAEVQQLRRSLEEETLRAEQERQRTDLVLQQKLAAFNVEVEQRMAEVEARHEADKTALTEAVAVERRSAQLRERLLVHHLVSAKRALAKAGACPTNLMFASGDVQDNGDRDEGASTEVPAQDQALKLTAAQRRQAKGRQAAADEAREDVEYLVRKHGNSGNLLPISRLPALYAEEYGRHRPLSLPSWEESLAQLETCHLITVAEAARCNGTPRAPIGADGATSATPGASTLAVAVTSDCGLDPKDGFVVWCGPEQ